MRSLWYLLLIIALGSTAVNAEWQETKEIRLKKDVTQTVIVRYDDQQRLLTFRWTLFTNGELVIHRSLDEFVAQNILSLSHKNQSLRVEFTPRGKKYGAISYLFITFKRFDLEKKEAVFELLLHDDEKKIVLKYLK